MRPKTLAFIFLGCAASLSLTVGLAITFRGKSQTAFDPHGASVTAARHQADSAIRLEFTHLEDKTALVNYGSEYLDECYQGQNNFKVHQGFGYRCTYRETRYYGFPADFESHMLHYLGELADLGWNTTGAYYTQSITNTADYYPPNPSDNNPANYLNGGMDTSKGDLDMSLDYQDYRYYSNDLRDSQSVILEAGLFITYTDKHLINLDTAIRNIAQHDQFLLVIGIQKNYFQTKP